MLWSTRHVPCCGVALWKQSPRRACNLVFSGSLYFFFLLHNLSKQYRTCILRLLMCDVGWLATWVIALSCNAVCAKQVVLAQESLFSNWSFHWSLGPRLPVGRIPTSTGLILPCLALPSPWPSDQPIFCIRRLPGPTVAAGWGGIL